MALKAGYVGVKKSLISIINSLASSIIIKDIGEGLDYDEETGKLSSEGGIIRKNVFIGDVNTVSEVTLTDDISDANLIEFVLSDNTSYRSSYIVGVNTLKTLPSNYVLGVWDYQYQTLNRYVRFSYTDGTHINITDIVPEIHLREVNIF